MSTKIVKLDEKGEFNYWGMKYIEENYSHEYAIYEIDKSKTTGFIHRTVRSTGKSRNYFTIKDKDGWFEVVWGVAVGDHGFANEEILIGQFTKLKDAEKRAVRVAIKMRQVENHYNHSDLFRQRQIKIDEVPLFTLSYDNKTFEFTRGQMEWDLDVPVLDMTGVQSKKQERLDKEARRQERLSGGEDTRIMVKILMNVDLQNLGESIADYLQGEVDTIDGVGADSDSTYTVDDVQVTVESTGQIEATFYLERESGKFAGKDELTDALIDQLGSSGTVEVPIEINN